MLSVARVMGVVARLTMWLAGLSLVAMTLFVFAQIVFRFGFNSSIVWSEPLAVILMGWFIFLGAAVGIREGYHLSFDVLVSLMGHRGKMILFSISDLFVLAFGVGMVWYGGQLALAGWHIMLPTLPVSRAIDYAPLVCGGVIIVMFTLERLARRAAGLPTVRFGDDREAA
jgi:TRAP-type C4-dicarboxylate transport system permease small subunit